VIFDPATDTFTDTGNTQFEGVLAGVPLLDGRALFIGTLVSPGAAIFIPSSNSLNLVAPVALEMGRTVTLLNNGRVLITGGFGNQGTVALAELFEPGSK
jgi:hypothetical protein